MERDQHIPNVLATRYASAPVAAAAPGRKRPKPGERRVQILQTLAGMLELPGADRITTAALAAKLEVSEAALYRHFASKAQMFEGLIEFIESSVFTLVNQIHERETDATVQVHKMLVVLLQFAEKNPGMARVMVGGKWGFVDRAGNAVVPQQEPQEDFETTLPLFMGQILSIPLVIIGIYFLVRSYRNLQPLALDKFIVAAAALSLVASGIMVWEPTWYWPMTYYMFLPAIALMLYAILKLTFMKKVVADPQP